MIENYPELFSQNQVEDGPISLLDLSPRAYNVLRLNDIHSLSQLAAMDEEKLKSLMYSSPLIAREIELCLFEYLNDTQNYRSEQTSTSETLQTGSAEKPNASLKSHAVPIENLGLSARSYHCLKRSGFHSVQDLIGKTEEELLRIRNLGSKSAAEIVEVVNNYLSTPHNEAGRRESAEDKGDTLPRSAVPASEHDMDDRPIKDLNLSVRSYNCLKNANIYTVQQLLDMETDALSKIRNLGKKSLEELLEVREKYKTSTIQTSKTEYSSEELKPLLLNAFQQPFQGLSWQEFRDAMPEAAGDDAIKRAVGELLAAHELEYVDFRCYRVYPSFYEYLETYLSTISGNDRTVLSRRYAGDTLEAIAQDLGITREWVRQIQAKQNRKLQKSYKASTGFPVFDEDYYGALFTRCELQDEFWTKELALPESSIKYLQFTFTHSTEKPETILHDEAIPVSLRYRVRSYLDRDKIRIDGKLFPQNRSALEEYAMKKYAQDEISFERFTELYNGMLEDEGIPFDEKLYYTDSVVRARTNRISDSRQCLWKQGARVRWYDIDARDYSELLETLNLRGYHDTEVSTRKFMRQYPELMERYDIRDAYELHNLLRKISDRYTLNFINFSRQPILQFGEFDRSQAVRETMIALAPVTQQDLLEYLYLEYGYDKSTAVGYLTPLSSYYHDGVYSVDFKQIPEQRVKAFRTELTEDFYYIDEIKHKYTNMFKEADPEEINPYSLKSLGFLVNSGYAIQHHPSAYAFFKHILTKDDLYDISPILRRYGSILMFSQTFAELLKTHCLFRFEKNQIISSRRLARLNVTEELVEDYCASVKAFVEEDSYFTVFSMRQGGFTHQLEMLGLSDYFYASLLGNDEHFSSCQMFGELVLYNGRRAQRLSRADFLLTQLREYDSVEPDEFMQDIKERFGLSIPDRYEITNAVNDSELYYDSIMDKIYREKALYYADIDEG